MLKIGLTILFCWLFFKVIGLAFKAAWGVAKMIATILLAVNDLGKSRSERLRIDALHSAPEMGAGSLAPPADPSVASLLKRPRKDHASSRVNLAPLATAREGKRFCVLMQAGPYKQRKYMFN